MEQCSSPATAWNSSICEISPGTVFRVFDHLALIIVKMWRIYNRPFIQVNLDRQFRQWNLWKEVRCGNKISKKSQAGLIAIDYGSIHLRQNSLMLIECEHWTVSVNLSVSLLSLSGCLSVRVCVWGRGTCKVVKISTATLRQLRSISWSLMKDVICLFIQSLIQNRIYFYFAGLC